jgi:hypothetical protein
VTRYTPSRNYLTAGLVAFALAALSAILALYWTPTSVPAVLFAISGALLVFLAMRPVVEVHPHHLRIGARVIPWSHILRVDKTGWISPLMVHLTLLEGGRTLLVYPGDYESSNQLLRQLRRAASNALIDGTPFSQYWSEHGGSESPEDPDAQARRYPLLRPEDEADIERMYQRLKAVGRLDPKDEG